eukprot:CAMPEP_0114631298 /NCGR_PEP_ID=MMETSP0168-20121206/14337_1 /TAXON_ID=95228 ORGANISM="Vannella sp., Strain DIVA3 517/6/12" /NCGR_SAMPLE_ID=MMETSP0168 /ASSEMBLY_ACC=CAM_ASM_000044 /LENGTH=378 /DNA_ID=CAMNT_0001842853 /DNA_START=24 /DNA_END=1160 /DNA_ORIENTATION=+
MATPGILPGANDSEKLEALCQKTYKEQAVWFLNAFWDDHESDGERLWQYAEKCAEVDIDQHEEGNGLDEMQAHVFLEKFDEALTVRQMRTKLRETGAIAEKQRPKKVPLTHYLLFRFNVDWHVLVNASQGDNSKEVAEAQNKLEQVQAAFQESQARATESAAALRASAAAEREAAAREAEAKACEAEALAREEDARREEAPFKAAQEELEAALAEVKRQEDEYQGKIDDCIARSEQGGVVSRNKAKQELAVLQAEDPLPLRKAKITLSAAHKRAEKARAPFEAATKEAEAARAAATASANEASAARASAAEALAASEAAKAAADAALDEAMARVGEAEAYLEEIKNRPGCAKGALWWIERELHESKKYIPEARGGIRK